MALFLGSRSLPTTKPKKPAPLPTGNPESTISIAPLKDRHTNRPVQNLTKLGTPLTPIEKNGHQFSHVRKSRPGNQRRPTNERNKQDGKSALQ